MESFAKHSQNIMRFDSTLSDEWCSTPRRYPSLRCANPLEYMQAFNATLNIDTVELVLKHVIHCPL